MKKQISLIILGLLAISSAFSQSSVWEINKNGNTLYLGGSVHLLRVEDYPLPKMFDKAFEKSDVLILEADIAQLENFEAAQKIMAQAMLPVEETLQTILDEETFKLLGTKCAELSLPLESLLKFKPSMVTTVLTAMKMQQMGFTPQGVDIYFYAKAKENDMKIDFLESIDFQINLMVNMGEGFENEFVKYSLKELDNIQAEMDKLIPAWRNGTSKYISSMLTEMKKTFPSVYKSMITDRHENWLPQIEKFLTNEPVEFVVVGAAHLHGDDGLLTELKNKGYTVKQLK